MENKLLKSIITELLNERKELDSQLSNQNQNKISKSIKELTQIFEEDIIPILDPYSIMFDTVCIENCYPTLRMCSFSKKTQLLSSTNGRPRFEKYKLFI